MINKLYMLRWEQASVSLEKIKVMQLMSRMSLKISTGESVCGGGGWGVGEVNMHCHICSYA